MKLEFTSMSKKLTKLIAVQMATLCMTTSLLISNIELKQKINNLERRSTTSVDFRNMTLLTSKTLAVPQVESVDSNIEEGQSYPNHDVEASNVEATTIEEIDSVDVESASSETIEVESYAVEEYASEYTLQYSQDEIYTIAKVCLAEAENQSEYGKRLVISTILNRLDSGIYGSTVYDVIYAPYQFEVTMNGRLDRVEPDEYMMDLVKQELMNRSNYDVFYFRTNYYSEYGTPMFVDGDHYFSSRYAYK